MAANAIGAIGPSAEPAVSHLNAAIANLDEDVQVLRASASALGAIGPEAASALPNLRDCDDPSCPMGRRGGYRTHRDPLTPWAIVKTLLAYVRCFVILAVGKQNVDSTHPDEDKKPSRIGGHVAFLCQLRVTPRSLPMRNVVEPARAPMSTIRKVGGLHHHYRRLAA